MKVPNRKTALAMLEDTIMEEPYVLPKCNDSSVALYGAGMLGEMAVDYLKRVGVGVEFIVDQNAKEGQKIDGVSVIPIDDMPVFVDKPILVSTVSVPFSQLFEQLTAAGWDSVHPFYDYAQNFLDKHPLNNGWTSGYMTAEDIDGIVSVASRLSDDYSRAAYIQMLEWRIGRLDVEFEGAPLTLDNRYFIPEVMEVLTSHEDYVDVGAYDGRVYSGLLGRVGDVNSATLIEPDRHNMKVLKVFARSLPEDMWIKTKLKETAIAYGPGSVMFNHGFGMTSNIGDIGIDTVKCTKLDRLIDKVTFLKIHAEGGELGIINGAREILKKCSPVVAVTLYHSRDGLWKIQQQLMDILGHEYDFHFRLHGWCAQGAVLYAIPRTRIKNG